LQKNGPFVSVSCLTSNTEPLDRELFGYTRGSFAGAGQDHQGLFIAADGGTLLLDEISHLPPELQAKLLSAIQNRSVRPLGATGEIEANPRVIALSRLALPEITGQGRIRSDLLYRLSVITIELPPLRLRMEDLPLLVEHILEELAQQSRRRLVDIEPRVWTLLDSYKWPGNVRELQHVIESAFCRGDGETLTYEEVSAAMKENISRQSNVSSARSTETPARGGDPLVLDDAMANVERQTILDALDRARGQRSNAAKLLGISRSRLYRRMEALGIPTRND
jgi:DNA-binding NtrC family response regulator